MSPHAIVLLALGLLTAAAALADHRTGHIPNRLVAVGFVLGLCLRVGLYVHAARSSDRRWTEVWGMAAGDVVLGVILCSAVPLLLFRLGAMGGGDVKLLACAGATVGPMLGLEVELSAFVLASLYAGARVAYRGHLLRLLGSSAALLVNPLLPASRRRAVPEELLTSLRFAPAVFASTLLTAFVSWRWS